MVMLLGSIVDYCWRSCVEHERPSFRAALTNTPEYRNSDVWPRYTKINDELHIYLSTSYVPALHCVVDP